MIVERGDIWWADLNPTRGSEQAGMRPVLVFQNDIISRHSPTVLAIPLTTNLKRASLPSSVFVPQGEAGLPSDSVALCNQLRVLDKTRLQHKLGTVSNHTLSAIEASVLFTTGIS